MNIKRIQELVDLMNNNDIAEIEIEQEGTKVKITKKGAGVAQQIVVPAPAVAVRSSATTAEFMEAPAKPAGNLKEIKSPMVGTFYRAPSPDAEPYVQTGTVVKKGDVLCIIEAMKMMNEVKAEFGGKIIDIPAKNAEPVEFGQTMFLIEPV